MTRRAVPLLAVLLFAPVARAQPSAPSGSAADGRAHFDRGVALFADGDHAAALVEFRRAMEVLHRPALLYNIAVTQEALGRYVEALDAMRAFGMQAPPEARARHQADLDAALARLPTRIGTLRVLTEAEGLSVQVDDQPWPTERARLGTPVSAGTRRVILTAPGFERLELSVSVAGGEVVELRNPLISSSSSVTVDCSVSGAAVRIDGEPRGETPLNDPIRVSGGRHRIQVTRPGYADFETELDVRGPGARVRVSLAWREPVPPEEGARLAVNPTEPGAMASLDGRPIALHGGALVPAGSHRLRVDVERFLPSEIDVSLAPRAQRVVDVWMIPTPAFRDEYLRAAQSARRTGLVAGGLGLVGLLSGGVALGFLLPAYRRDLAAFDARTAEQMECSLAGTCPVGDVTILRTREAESAALRSGAGAVVSGVVAAAGLVSLVVGIAVYSRAGSSRRFDRPSWVHARLEPRGAGLTVDF